MARASEDPIRSKLSNNPSGRASRRGGRKKREPSSGAMTDEELRNTICSYFSEEGLTAVQIQKRLKQDHGVTVTREKPYEYVRKAAAERCFRFVLTQEHSLEQQIRGAHTTLQDVIVVQTARSEDVAYRGAQTLLEILQRNYCSKKVHIGFSGGTALRMLARRFAELLHEPVQNLPSEIVFHALVAGFDVSDPTTDPNAFFTYFVGEPTMPFETSFVALHTPAMVEARFEEGLQGLPAIKEAYDRASEIDIVVTSTSCWTDPHSMLRHYMAVAGESVDELEKAGCLGDILWQPIGADGPFVLKSKIRAMTTMNLDRLSNLVAQGKQVLLVAGPCHKCHAPKTQVVKAILDQQHRLITHLVTDSRCAREML